MKLKLIIVITLLQIQICKAQDKWNIDGKNSLVSLTIPLYNPVFITSEHIATKTLFKPGFSVEYRYILNPKMEINLGVNRDKFTEVFKDYTNIGGVIDTTLVDVSKSRNGLTLGTRLYSISKNKGIAPIGKFFYFGLEVNMGKISAAINDTRSYTGKHNTINLDIGLGKEFHLKENLFFSFSAHARLPVVVLEKRPDSLDELLRDAVDDARNIGLLRNILVAKYGVSYLF